MTSNGQPSKPRVLVVDDERVIADTLSAILSKHGFAVMTAYSGATALDLARVTPPDLLISDVAMPEMNGIEATERGILGLSAMWSVVVVG